MTIDRYDVTAIGNAIVDLIVQVEPAFLEKEGLSAGSMQLIDAPRAAALTAGMRDPRQISGGSAANTIAGMAALGCRCGFIGQVAEDRLGAVFGHELRALDVAFTTPARRGEPETARCLIFVTPDGQRTMNTFLGASQFLPASAIDETMISASKILYLEGYLWDPEEPRAAMRRAIEIAHGAERQVAFTLSDPFCIDRHGDDFRALIDSGAIDILFGNEIELAALTGNSDFDAALSALAAKVPTLVVTRGPKGAVACQGGHQAKVAAEPVAQVLDTTGAGDLFAAGFLAGQTRNLGLQESLVMGAVCAGEVIAHFGPRPEADLKALVDARLG